MLRKLFARVLRMTAAGTPLPQVLSAAAESWSKKNSNQPAEQGTRNIHFIDHLDKLQLRKK